MIRRLLGACIGVMVVAAWGCGGEEPAPIPEESDITDDAPRPPPDSGTGNEDAGTGDDAGTGTDAGTEDDGGTGTDAGTGDDGGTGTTDGGTDGGTGTTDGGTGTDGGTDGGTAPTPGPWPTDAVSNYSERYGLDGVESVGVDAAHNIWLLDGDRIGVLRADTRQVVWSSGVGQAGEYASTVICGGAAGQAYVGYMTENDIPGGNRISSPGEPDFSQFRWDTYFKQGDMDAVRLDAAAGVVKLEEHLYQSAGSSRATGNPNIGLHNSNDYHFDEDRSIYSCKRVMRGQYAGEVYIGTNHGVTRIRGLVYSSHRHPAFWVEKKNDDGSTSWSQRAGYTYGLGIANDGSVLIANDWKIGVIQPIPNMADWHYEERGAAYALNVFVTPVNGGPDYRTAEAPFAYWRGFEQTADGAYYVGSRTEGLYRIDVKRRVLTDGTYRLDAPQYTRVEGAGISSVSALAATDDGSLFIGTERNGLWRLKPDRTLEKVTGVQGSDVKQLIYDPTVTPASLYVLVNKKVFVLRGY